MSETCAMCERGYPHSLHIFIGADGDIHGQKGDDDVSLESSRFCPLCNKPCTFYDPEFNNDFCRDCSWMGEGIKWNEVDHDPLQRTDPTTPKVVREVRGLQSASG